LLRVSLHRCSKRYFWFAYLSCSGPRGAAVLLDKGGGQHEGRIHLVERRRVLRAVLAHVADKVIDRQAEPLAEDVDAGRERRTEQASGGGAAVATGEGAAATAVPGKG
jgi:hypothetical protein